jgi:glycosyltransferase involved in cell wall biosynthesis
MTKDKEKSPLLTVLITTYNYGRFIEESVDSVLSQDFPLDKIEVVVVDDGSTDDTAERVKKYGPRISYFYQANAGQAAALNLGFAKAKGDIIVLLDADDYFLPGKLARVARAFEEDPRLGMFYHPFLEFDMETGERRESKFPPLISGSLYDDPKIFLWYAGPGTCASFRRKFVEQLLPIPENIRMLADGYLGSLIVLIAPILAVPECLAAYRFHGKNAYHSDENQMPVETRKNRLEMFQPVIQAMRKWVADNGYTRQQRAVRIFLDRWTLFQQTHQFLIKPPGRLRFFWFTVFENYASSPVQTWKLTAFNYLFAPSALVFGYERSRLMYEWRGRAMAAAEHAYRAFFGRGSKPGSAWKGQTDTQFKP